MRLKILKEYLQWQWAAIIDETFSGAPVEQVANVQSDIIYTFFGRGISMGKGQGLMGMISMCKHYAERFLQKS